MQRANLEVLFLTFICLILNLQGCKFNQASTLTVAKVFNVRATNFLSGALTNSIFVEEGAQFIVVTTTAGSAITFVSEDTNIGGKVYTSVQAVSNGCL
jgi:hypothetical protein